MVCRKSGRAGLRSRASTSAARLSVSAQSHCGTTPACTISQPCSCTAMRWWRTHSISASRSGAFRMVGDGVALVGLADAMGHGQQMQVMVAEQAGRGVAQAPDQPQGGQRGRPRVDQVTEQVDPVPRGREVDFFQQGLQSAATALDVADQIVHAGIVLSKKSMASATLAPFFQSKRIPLGQTPARCAVHLDSAVDRLLLPARPDFHHLADVPRRSCPRQERCTSGRAALRRAGCVASPGGHEPVALPRLFGTPRPVRTALSHH